MPLFLLLVSISVVLISGGALWQSWQHELQENERLVKNQSLALSRQAQDTFLQVQITLQEIARNADDIFSSPGHYAGTQGLLARQKALLPQLNGLFVFDANGISVANSAPGPLPAYSNGDRDYFSWHRRHDNQQMHIGHVIRSRSNNEPVIPVSLRLDDAEGHFRGVALGTVRVDYFRQYYDYFEIGEHDVLGLTHRDATMLYVRPFADRLTNHSMAHTPLYQKLLKVSPTGSGTWRSPIDGITRIFGYAMVPHYPLVAAVGIDRDALRKAWLRTNLGIICLNLLMLMLVMLFGLLLLRQLRLMLENQAELLRARDELTQANHRLQDLALIDSLTGLANRRQFDIYLEQCIERAATTGVPMSLIMCDIDYFKRYNDTRGHVAGDACLRRIADILKSLAQRNGDVVARYGGEEFAFVLPATDASAALALAQRILAAVRAAALPHVSTELAEKIVTLSIGVSTFSIGSNADSLVHDADQALYAAKRNGRNQIVTRSPTVAAQR